MTIEQCYSAIESNYEEVLGRFAGNKMLVEKFARKFLDDPSYQTLVSDLTEELRGGAPDEAKLPELLEKVSSEYKKTVDAINCVNE